MTRITEELPPFLAKLVEITQKTPKTIADWSEDGYLYIVKSDDNFNRTLKKYFKGTKQTFVRQLHFYGFKKVDVPNAWGFGHEQRLFARDNLSLVKDIKRKRKVDPDTERIATFTEVQSLKNQVTFLQELVEELKSRVTGIKTNCPGIQKSLNVPNPQKKRQRPDENLSFKDICAKVVCPVDYDLSKLPSFTNTMDIDTDLENLSDLFVELDLEPIPSKPSNLKRVPSYQEAIVDDSAFDLDLSLSHAVEAISEATNVKKSDVSKIITFLSTLSLSEQRKLDINKYSLSNKFTMSRLQKVGAS